MTSLRFLHTADLHLGTPFQGLTQDLPPSWAQRIREAADTVFERIVDEALAYQVDFVTMTGDLFDREGAAMSAHFALLRGFERLQEAGIQVIMTHGNHDPLRQEQPIHWPDNVTVLGACEADSGKEVAPSVVVETRGGQRVQVSGFSYTSPELRRPLDHAFVRQDGVDFAIGLYHGAVGTYRDHENYCATSVDNLSSRGFDFWGLGHIHQPGVLRAVAPAIVYPGNPQGRHARETGRRGCTLAEVTDTGEVRLSFLPTATVEWGNMELSVEGCQDIAEILTETSRQITQVFPQDGVFRIVRLALTGATPAHKWLEQDQETLQQIRHELSDRFQTVLISHLTASTMPMADIDRLRKSEEFIGAFLRLCDDYLQNPEKIRGSFGPLLESVFHLGNELHIDDLPDEQLRQLVLDARGHALAFVGEEDAL